MIEILFRGKTKQRNWVEGNGIMQGQDCISSVRWVDICNDRTRYEVIPETVGRFTGFTDKNGTKIFEGDIVRYNDGVFYVEYYAPHMAFYFHGTQGRGSANGFTRTSNDIEVIGNIHDNPELLEKTE